MGTQKHKAAEGKDGSTVPETPVKGRSVSPREPLGPTKADGSSSAATPSPSPSGPTKADGTPDMRYAANKSVASSSYSSLSYTPTYSSPSYSSGPTKADGTLDMRYSCNRK
jgi:hypothetical protein